MSITFNIRYLKNFVNQNDFWQMEEKVKAAHKMIHSKKGIFEKNIGWLDLPVNYDRKELEKIKTYAAKIRKMCDAFIVIGIGGSYLGARAAIEFLNSHNYNLFQENCPHIFFVGNSLAPSHIYEIMDLCEKKRICINVISKSGTTTEPAVAFKIFKDFMEKKVGTDEARKRIFCTTDKNKGILRSIADKESYESFVIPDDIGGRFSVLSPVGLLPIAVSGANIDEIMLGALEASQKFMQCDLEKNDCYKYAAARNILYKKGKIIELFSAYTPRFSMLLEWLKQLYAESEGKEQKGIFPTSAMYSTDLHSLGQFIQEGSRIFFETSLTIKNEERDITLKTDNENSDGLNFLGGQNLSYVNKMAYEATALAHYDGGVPGIEIQIDRNSEKELGELLYFFEKSCAISGLILGINPFNQPGVEAYKKNMFALIGKPGYEDLRNDILNRLRQ